MATSRYTNFVVVVTGATLILQLLILYNNQSHFSSPSSKLLNNRVFENEMIILGSAETNSKIKMSSGNILSHTTGKYTQLTTKKRRLTIGIPTIKRKDGNYFFNMLSSMLNKTSEEDLKEVVFVVFLADSNNTVWKTEMEAILKSNYSKYIDTGSLMVVQAPVTFYDTMTILKNDSYANWRSKQNYDFAFLMKYCVHFSELYMQMEDDVIASDNYYTAIKDFIKQQPNDNWICLEFSELGFIGKLYHSKHIANLAQMFLMFSHSNPVDYIFVYFNILMGQHANALRKPTLFQHMGYHSSLAEKIQPLRDRYFDFPLKQLNGDNPTASISTSLPLDQSFPPELPYSKEPGYFWSRGGANINDTFIVMFNSPNIINKIVVETGSKEHPADKIHNGVIEVSASVIINNGKSECFDFIYVNKFINGSANVDNITTKVGPLNIRCVRIRFTMSQFEWVIVREIAFFLSHK